MTLPNEAAGLNPNVSRANAVTADGSIPQQANNTQGAIEPVLAGQMQQSPAWNGAHQAGYGGLTGAPGTPLNYRTLNTVATRLFNKPDGTWGTTDEVVDGLGTNAVQTTSNDLVNMLFGWLGGGYPRETAQQALADQRAAVATLSASVAALQAHQVHRGYAGNSEVIDFSTRPDATSLGSDFTQTYTGVGTGLWGITSGKAVWQPVNNNPRGCVAVYNAEQTTTDYQIVGATFATAPMIVYSLLFFPVAYAYNFLFARANAAGTSMVYAMFSKTAVELGCVVGGVQTTWATELISFKANGIYWLECGTSGGARIFRVLDGTVPLITHTEVGTTSQLGSGFRYAGAGVDPFQDGLFTYFPGEITAWTYADNTPPTFVGSGAYMYRTSLGGVGVSLGTNLLPNNFFGVIGDHTGDITIDTVTGKFTVSHDGWYTVTARILTAANNFALNLVLYKNGVAYLHGGTGYSPVPSAVAGIWTTVYLEVGDYIQLGYESSVTIGGVMLGSTGGNKTYFGITLGNKEI